jgi:UPF0271 protein
MDRLILNADLGEGEAQAITEELMSCIGAANIACGGHAGSLGSLHFCLDLAKRHGVLAGAHPGLAGHFGRGEQIPPANVLRDQIWKQLHRFQCLACKEGVPFHHIKLHGSLYHAVEDSSKVALDVLETASRLDSMPVFFSLAGGNFCRLARSLGWTVWEEVFLDRGYTEEGRLVPRGMAGDQITEDDEVRRRIRTLLQNGTVSSLSGRILKLKAQTLCLHGDGKDVVRRARLASEELSRKLG